MTDFDEIVNRRGTASLKWDAAVERGKPADVLPLWVADMDHRTAQPIIDALRARAEEGIFGYTAPDETYNNALVSWFDRRYDLAIDPEWNTILPGVVPALSLAVLAYTEPGEAVLIEEPVYYPFRSVVETAGRKVVSVPLVKDDDGVYGRDLAAVEQAIVGNDIKLMLLCSPHNPVGRLWSEAELRGLAEVAKRHRVIVVADEIHADLTYPGHTTIPFISLDEETAQLTVMCTAPSKTFNLAGLQLANIFIPNPELRAAFRHQRDLFSYFETNVFGMVACRAAYESGDEWLDSLREHMASNRDYVLERLATIEGITAVDQQATYLMWLDCAMLAECLGIEPAKLDEEFFVQRAGLWLDDGLMFGAEGLGYTRINIACPRRTLEEAFDKIEAAIASFYLD